MLGKPSNNTTFELIPDDAIEDEEHDYFGHGAFANWLLFALESSKKSINIGLFGKWGTGKTGILKVLKKKLDSNHPKQYKYCYIDCWRISPDHIRRQLLIEINYVLKGLTDSELLEQLTQTTERHGVAENGKKLAKSMWELIKSSRVPGAIAIGITAALFAVDWVFDNWIFFDADILPILGPVFLAPFITQLAVNLSKNNDRIIQTVTKVIPPVNSHAEFEKIFERIISRHSKKKIVIALDNLDRCEGDVAIEILAIVKSFMEKPRVFFIIPCDSVAITKHLEDKRNFKDDMAEEFLRKFFQVFITVPPLGSRLMIDYVDKLVKEYNIPANDEVKSIISIASMDNPRRIKRFLNNYTANYYLAMELEKKSLEKETITGKRGFLTKILVLQDKFPAFYNELINEENLLEYVEKPPNDKDIPDYDQSKIDSLLDVGGLRNFLELTRHIKVDNISPFIKLSQDPHEKIPEYAEIRDAMRTNNYQQVNKIISSDSSKLDRFIETIVSTVKVDFKKGRILFGTNDLNIILHAYDATPDSHKNKLIETFGKYAASENILSRDIFDLKIVSEFIDEMKEKDNQNDILDKYCRVFFNSGNHELLKLLINRNHLFTDTTKNLFKELLVEFYRSREDDAISAINQHFKDEHIVELLDNKIIEAVLRKMTEDISDRNQNRINTYLQIKQVSNEQSKFEFIEKLLRIIVPEPKQDQLDDRINFVLSVLENLDHSDVTEDGMSLIYDIMNKYEGSLPNEDQKSKTLVPIIKHFDKLSDGVKTTFINDKLQNCFSRSDDSLIIIFSAMNSSRGTFLNYDRIFDAMSNVVSSSANPHVFEYLIENTTETKRDRVLDLIKSHITGQDELRRKQTCSVIEKAYVNLKEIDEIVPSIISALNNPYYTDRGEMLNLLSTVFVKCSSTQDDIIREFVKWSGDGTFGTNAINYLNKIWSNPDYYSKRSIIWNRIIALINNSFNNARLILDFLVEKGKITEKNRQSVVDVLINQIGRENLIVLEYMIKIRRMFTLDEDTIRKILEIPEDNDQIRELKEQFRNAGQKDND